MSKSEIMKQVAEKLGLPLIDIKLSEVDNGDFIGEDLSLRGKFNEVMDEVVEKQMMDKLMIIDDCDPVIAAMTRDIKVGDTVLMEYAEGVVETVVVDEIDDGMVYATGDDGEPFCAPLANCDKIPV